MTCSVVIPNWNGRHFLGACLGALQNQTFRDFEVVLVDNASSDGSVAFVRERFPEVRIIEAEENVGFAGGMNLGIRAGQGEYVAFLNNDTEAEPRWLEELVACLERHPDAAAATGKMVLLDRPDTIDSAGDGITPLFLPYARGHGKRDGAQYEREEQVFSASGGAALWRRAALEEIGLFDDAFFAYYEDVDLGFRARLAGYECWYAPKAIVRHRRGGSIDGETEFTFFHHVRNRLLLILKNVPASVLARSPHLLVAGELYWWARARRSGQLRALLRAYGAVASDVPRVLQQRRDVQRRSRVPARELRRYVAAESPRRAWRNVV